MKVSKILKVVLWTAGSVVGLVILLVATLPLWCGSIARPMLNHAAPGWTKTSFNLSHLWINPYTGRFELGDMVVGNPEGYKEPTAIAISNLVVDVAMTTLCDKYVHIEEITVDGLFLSIVKGGDNNVDNLLQIQYNLAGGKEQYEANMEKNKAKKAAAQAKADAKAKAELEKEAAKLSKMTDEEREAYEQKKEDIAAAKAEAEQKYVIDRVFIRGVKVKYGLVTIPVPVTIELHDLGKESEGINFSEFYEAVWEAIINSAMKVGDGAKVLGEFAVAGVDAALDGAKKVGGAVGDGAKKVGDAVGEGAKKALDKIGGLFK